MDNKKYKCGWITSTYWINFTTREEAIKGDEKRVYAKTKEYDLLELLYDNRERMLDYDCIAKKIWYGLDSTSNSNINKVICNLRKIIKDEKKGGNYIYIRNSGNAYALYPYKPDDNFDNIDLSEIVNKPEKSDKIRINITNQAAVIIAMLVAIVAIVYIMSNNQKNSATPEINNSYSNVSTVSTLESINTTSEFTEPVQTTFTESISTISSTSETVCMTEEINNQSQTIIMASEAVSQQTIIIQQPVIIQETVPVPIVEQQQTSEILVTNPSVTEAQVIQTQIVNNESSGNEVFDLYMEEEIFVNAGETHIPIRVSFSGIPKCSSLETIIKLYYTNGLVYTGCETTQSDIVCIQNDENRNTYVYIDAMAGSYCRNLDIYAYFDLPEDAVSGSIYNIEIEDGDTKMTLYNYSKNIMGIDFLYDQKFDSNYRITKIIVL